MGCRFSITPKVLGRFVKVMTVPESLQGGPWTSLLQQAFRLIDDFQAKGGLSDPFWTLGGGTVLMFRYHHRKSKDIDIFVPDPQYLGYVTPRVSDLAMGIASDYVRLRRSGWLR